MKPSVKKTIHLIAAARPNFMKIAPKFHHDLRLDPPVNKRIPIARNRLEGIHKILGL